MDFNIWLSQIKNDNLELEPFLKRIEPFFTDSGFNINEFEKRVQIGIKTIDAEVDSYLTDNEDVKD